MRKFLIAAVAVSGLAFSSASVRAEEHEGVHGILIDNKCAMKDGKAKEESEVAKHPASCVLKCADSGIGVTSKDKWIKFDEKGQKLAKEYLEKHKDDKGATKVHVEGKVSEDGKTMEVTAIHADKKKDGEKKES
jgi:hypothetical protein